MPIAVDLAGGLERLVEAHMIQWLRLVIWVLILQLLRHDDGTRGKIAAVRARAVTVAHTHFRRS